MLIKMVLYITHVDQEVFTYIDFGIYVLCGSDICKYYNK